MDGWIKQLATVCEGLCLGRLLGQICITGPPPPLFVDRQNGLITSKQAGSSLAGKLFLASS